MFHYGFSLLIGSEDMSSEWCEVGSKGGLTNLKLKRYLTDRVMDATKKKGMVHD